MILTASTDVLAWVGIGAPVTLAILGAEANWRRKVSKRLTDIEADKQVMNNKLQTIESAVEDSATQTELRMTKDFLADKVKSLHDDLKERFDDLSRRVP